ncbi:MAG: galactose mutarotase [Chlorobi bacterium]|nr:galactose mutarotase [Chlorobiota bacterium]
MLITKSSFGKLKNGVEVSLYTLLNNNGMEVAITNYGGIVTSIKTPDKNGVLENVVLGFNGLESYISDEYLQGYPYFGCIIGRFGNRIANGRFTLNGKEYRLAINNGPNHLHGGNVGFDRVVWDAEEVEQAGKVGVKLSYLSPDGEENYPGNLKATVIYSLSDDNKFGIEYFAETDKATPVNLTQHSYFNLAGGRGDILGHQLQIFSNKRTQLNEDAIPTGKIIPVEGTAYDFRELKPIGKDIAGLPDGYDRNFVLDNEKGKLIHAAKLVESNSGRIMDVFTTEVGLQLYTGFWIPEIKGYDGAQYGKYAGVALETQHFPDSVNHPEFPTTILNPGEQYNQKTIYRFSTFH